MSRRGKDMVKATEEEQREWEGESETVDSKSE